MQFVDLKTQYRRIELDVKQRIHAVLEHGHYINGPEVNELEEALADYVGTHYCIGVSSGTDALLIALMALGIQANDEVITTDFSFFATAEAIALLGAKPVVVDIVEDTYNIDPQLIEKAITDKTKAIIPVSLYGQCADFDEINRIAARHHLPVIEDGAQSFGASYKGKKSCGLTTIGCTSFFPSKPLGCYGDGGACFTNDLQLATAMREIRIHGQSKRYQHTRLGINGRLDTLQAAILLAKLPLFEEEIQLRQAAAARYTQQLPARLHPPTLREGNTSAYAQYTIRVPHRDAVLAVLQELNVPTAVHYPQPLSQQAALLNGSEESSTPLASRMSKEVMSLPMHPYLSESDQELIVRALEKAELTVGFKNKEACS